MLTSSVEVLWTARYNYQPSWKLEPLLNGAVQEYRYLSHRDVLTQPSYKPITNNDSWVVGDEDDKTYLSRHLLHDQPER